MADDTSPNAPAHTNHDWDTRYSTAWSALNNASAMAPLYGLVADADPGAAPRAVAVAGQARLSSARRVGLLPGSFNPLTLAHIALAEAARRATRLDLVAWGIAARTVDKEEVLRATIPDRLAQLAAYTRSSPSDAVLLFNRGLYVEQAEALHALMGGAVEVAIVVGFDKVVQILDPRYYEDREAALRELFDRATLVVAPRLRDNQATLLRLLAQPENAAYARYITYMDLAPRFRDDSSTEARATLEAQLATADRARALVPPEASALARLAPYAAAHDPSRDAYMTRVRWLTVLRSFDRASLATLPSVADLVARTLSEHAQGACLRQLLDSAERTGAPPAISHIRRCLDHGDAPA